MIDSMGGHINPKSGNNQFPDSGLRSSHPCRMRDDEPDALLALIAKNVSLLVTANYGDSAGKGINQLMQHGQLSRGTAGRVVTPGSTSWSVTVLPRVAEALKVQPWQLLLPDLQVSQQGSIVSIEGLRARQWPFPTLAREELEGLSPTELERLEKTIRSRLKELKEDRPAQKQASSQGNR